METVPWEDELTQRLSREFGPWISQFATYRGQNFLAAQPEAIVPLLEYLKTEEEFDFLVDVTAVDYPGREERFEIIYIVYSFAKNQRIRIKTHIREGQNARSVLSVHPTANWLEREIFDMFGIEFTGHGDLRRILMPDDWRGHPLRKDYDILNMDNRWVQENLEIESGQ